MVRCRAVLSAPESRAWSDAARSSTLSKIILFLWASGGGSWHYVGVPFLFTLLPFCGQSRTGSHRDPGILGKTPSCPSWVPLQTCVIYCGCLGILEQQTPQQRPRVDVCRSFFIFSSYLNPAALLCTWFELSVVLGAVSPVSLIHFRTNHVLIYSHGLQTCVCVSSDEALSEQYFLNLSDICSEL